MSAHIRDRLRQRPGPDQSWRSEDILTPVVLGADKAAFQRRLCQFLDQQVGYGDLYGVDDWNDPADTETAFGHIGTMRRVGSVCMTVEEAARLMELVPDALAAGVAVDIQPVQGLDEQDARKYMQLDFIFA